MSSAAVIKAINNYDECLKSWVTNLSNKRVSLLIKSYQILLR
jgi:hypothetical protein